MNGNKQLPAEHDMGGEFLSNNRVNIRIVQALTRLFDRHRIIFWYDAKHELRDDFEALSLPGVERSSPTTSIASNTGCCGSSRTRSSFSTVKAG
jgi:hypothetical protein